MKAIVGYTGFVGSNLCRQIAFDGQYHSKNIATAYHTNPEFLVYAGVRAEKHLANQFPEMDKKLIEDAIENIQKINPKQLVLISTIDVYKDPNGKNEESEMEKENLHPYGYHRLLLEEWVRENVEDHLIIRLPALFGKNIKKNFIYDFIHRIPAMLKPEKMEELIFIEPLIEAYYEKGENGFYICKAKDKEDKNTLRNSLEKTNFNALYFTDSRAKFQFYDLSRLGKDIERALELDIKTLNVATEPVSVLEIYDYLTDEEFRNEIAPMAPAYDFRSKYAKQFGGKAGYFEDKETVLKKIKEFVDDEISNL